MKIIYLHGFNSDGNGGTALKLKEHFGKDILTLDYDYINPDKAYHKINNTLIEMIGINENLIISGTSLGGFWANHFADKFGIKAVLVNPSLRPDISLTKYIGENKNFTTGKTRILNETLIRQYTKYIDPSLSFNTKYVLLGVNDDVINHTETAVALKEHSIFLLPNEGHRLNDINILINALNEIMKKPIVIENLLFESTIINERVINAKPTDIQTKTKYVDQVWDILQKSYAPIGGIHGSGFNSKEDMIKNIPFWKIIKRNGEIVCVGLYKDKHGRKRVAGGTNGSQEGKEAFAFMSKEDLQQQRTYSEVSGPSLSYIKKQLSNFKDYVMDLKQVESILGEEIFAPDDNDPEVIKHSDLKDFFYQREIGGKLHTKLMIGKAGNDLM